MRPRVPPLATALGLGALAAGPALLILVAFRAVSGSTGFLEAAADGTLRYVPLPVFDAGIAAFGPAAKGGAKRRCASTRLTRGRSPIRRYT